MRTRPPINRGGYTAIELMLVLGIVSALSMMSAPSVINAMRKASTSEAADIVVQVTAEARGLAMRNQVADQYYGVIVGVDEAGRGYAALAYTAKSPATDPLDETDIMVDPDGRPVLKLVLKRSVMLMVNGQPMAAGDAPIGWLHQYRTGAPVRQAKQSAPAVSVGTPASPVCTSMGVQTLDARYAAAVAVFPIGITGVEVGFDGEPVAVAASTN